MIKSQSFNESVHLDFELHKYFLFFVFCFLFLFFNPLGGIG